MVKGRDVCLGELRRKGEAVDGEWAEGTSEAEKMYVWVKGGRVKQWMQ